jgi:hypothetical protein
LNSGENDRRSRRPCFRFFCCFMDHSRAFSRYPGCPPAGVKLKAPLAELAREIVRPSCLGETSTLPHIATFVCRAPSVLVEGLGEQRAAATIATAVARHRSEAQTRRAAEGRGFLGIKRVLAADAWTRPATPPRGAGFDPTFKGVIAEALAEARKVLLAFRRAYAVAMEEFRAGLRDIVFPPGTYLMRRRLGCPCDRACA